MSDFKFPCPLCGQKISCDTGYSGTQISCPSCQKPFTVPSAPSVTAPPEVAAPAAARPAGPPPGDRPRPAPRPLPWVPPEPDPATAQLPGATATGYPYLAIASLLCSVFAVVGWIPGIICGHMAKAKIARNPLYNGEKMATVGLVISYASLGLLLFAGSAYGLVQMHFQPIVNVRVSPVLPPAPQARVVDEVIPGQSSSENSHGLMIRGQTDAKAFTPKPATNAPPDAAGALPTNAMPQRTALKGGSFAYRLKVLPDQPMSINCRYWGGEKGTRTFDIAVNDQIIATQVLATNAPGHFMDVEYKIPQSLTAGQKEVRVEFEAHKNVRAGGVFVCQTLRR